MDIGRLFSHAWGLFLKDVGPLIVGGLIAGLIPMLAGGIIFAATLGATFAGASISQEGEITGVSSLGWGLLLVVGAVLLVVVVLLLSAPLYAGLVSGVVRRVREGRAMRYGDAFDGFRFFGAVVGASVLMGLAFVAIAAVPVAIALAAAAASSAMLGVVAAVAGLVAAVAWIYLYTLWVYVFPVIVDRGLSATTALSQSSATVRASGWWITLLAILVMTIVIGVIGGVLGVIPILGSVASLLLTPFALAYVVAMYFQAGSEAHLIETTLRGDSVTPVSPAMYPPAEGARPAPYPPAQQSYPVTPVEQSPVADSPEPSELSPPAGPAVVPPPSSSDADAWRSASDPLAEPPSDADVPEAPAAPTAPEEPSA